MFGNYEIGINPDDVSEAVKSNAAVLLEKLSELVEADPYVWSYYLGLRLVSEDADGLVHGLVIRTDCNRELDEKDQAAYKFTYGSFTFYCCSGGMQCIIIEELEPANFNVKTLTWEKHGVCRISEEGPAPESLEELESLFRMRGQTTRDKVTRRLGLTSDGLLLDERNATPEDVNDFFAEALRISESNEMVPLSVGLKNIK